MFPIIGQLLLNAVTGPVAASRNNTENKKSVSIDTNNCTFCGICSKRCPSHAIKANKIEKIISIDHLNCFICGLCEEECPKKCISVTGSCQSSLGGR